MKAKLSTPPLYQLFFLADFGAAGRHIGEAGVVESSHRAMLSISHAGCFIMGRRLFRRLPRKRVKN
jgi:hypothetical protein